RAVCASALIVITQRRLGLGDLSENRCRAPAVWSIGMNKHSNSIIMLISVLAGIGLGVSKGLAEHVSPGGASPPPGAEPYNIETFGAFRDLMLRGDFSPKVALGSVMMRAPSTGVGAVSGARGEITILDAKLIVSYGKPDAHSSQGDETAA